MSLAFSSGIWFLLGITCTFSILWIIPLIVGYFIKRGQRKIIRKKEQQEKHEHSIWD